MRCLFSALKIIGADGENDCVALLYRGVIVCQLDELPAADWSPESAVEDEHDVAVPPIRA